ncbi:MAG: hypothetical protein ACI353_00320 [Alloprevotella sp.]
MKAYIQPQSTVVELTAEQHILSGSELETKNTYNSNEEYSDRKGWNSGDWSSAEE